MENPSEAHEKLLESLYLDCSMSGCWGPIRGYVQSTYIDLETGEHDVHEVGLCSEHLRPHDPKNIRWLES
jgi:hypothetical protein